jgi:transketolase
MELSVEKITKLENISAQARYLAVETVINSGLGHLGGSLSSIDIMTVLYFDILNINSKNLNDPDRDRFILSKGHASVGLYSIFALKGILDKSLLSTFRKDGSILAGHPEPGIPGVEHGTGSLGHGLSVGVGMAISGKIDKRNYKTTVIIGDGESQEGQVWEAAMSAAHYKLDNLTAILDRNNLQIDGPTEDIMQLGQVKAKWESFGWTVKVVDGHSIPELLNAFYSLPFEQNKPSIIIAETIKGKGVDFMENQVKWHGGAPSGKEADHALMQLELKLKL